MLFVVSKKKEKAQLHDRIAGRFESVRRRFAMPVSAVVVTEAELHSAKLAPVVDAVRRDGILLFGSPHGLPQDVRRRSSDRAGTVDVQVSERARAIR
jgi:hypothetical protein